MLTSHRLIYLVRGTCIRSLGLPTKIVVTSPQMKTSESQFSVLPPEELHDVDGAYGFSGGGASRPNGISIITINMKNNHLIVETEEPVSVSKEE